MDNHVSTKSSIIFRTGRIPKPDHLLALFVIDSFNGSGLAGVFVAGIFSASLSTISPLFNSLAAVTFEDYAKVRNH